MAIKYPVSDYSENEMYQIFAYLDFTVSFMWKHFNQWN